MAGVLGLCCLGSIWVDALGGCYRCDCLRGCWLLTWVGSVGGLGAFFYFRTYVVLAGWLLVGRGACYLGELFVFNLCGGYRCVLGSGWCILIVWALAHLGFAVFRLRFCWDALLF